MNVIDYLTIADKQYLYTYLMYDMREYLLKHLDLSLTRMQTIFEDVYTMIYYKKSKGIFVVKMLYEGMDNKGTDVRLKYKYYCDPIQLAILLYILACYNIDLYDSTSTQVVNINNRYYITQVSTKKEPIRDIGEYFKALSIRHDLSSRLGALSI